MRAIVRTSYHLRGGGFGWGRPIPVPERGGRAPRPREHRSLLRARKFAGAAPDRGSRVHTPAFAALLVIGLTAVLGAGVFTGFASARDERLTLAMSSLPGLPASSVTAQLDARVRPTQPGATGNPARVASSIPAQPPAASATDARASGTATPTATAEAAASLASAPATPEPVASDQRANALTEEAAPRATPNSVSTPAAAPAPPPLYHTYTVQAGDTVSGIASRFGVRTQDVVSNNAGVLSAGSLLLVGASLQVPTVSGVLHHVQVGESLAEIADRYGVSLQDILGFPGNQLDDPSNVLEGTQILVVNGTPPAAPAAPVPEPTPAPTPEPTPVPTPTAPPRPVYQFIWPLRGNITSYFGPSHPKGIDISVAFQPVAASATGKVVFVGGDPCCSYGYYIDIQHADGYMTRYAHLSKFLVSRGQQVSQGDTIAVSGNTGYSTGAHLHFEILRNGAVRNPLDFLP